MSLASPSAWGLMTSLLLSLIAGVVRRRDRREEIQERETRGGCGRVREACGGVWGRVYCALLISEGSQECVGSVVSEGQREQGEGEEDATRKKGGTFR